MLSHRGAVRHVAPGGRTEEPVGELTSPAKPGRYTLTIKQGEFDRIAHVHIPPSYQGRTRNHRWC